MNAIRRLPSIRDRDYLQRLRAMYEPLTYADDPELGRARETAAMIVALADELLSAMDEIHRGEWERKGLVAMLEGAPAATPAKFLSEAQAFLRLKALVDESTQTAVALRAGVTPAMVHYAVKGKHSPKGVLEALGYRAVTMYEERT